MSTPSTNGTVDADKLDRKSMASRLYNSDPSEVNGPPTIVKMGDRAVPVDGRVDRRDLRDLPPGGNDPGQSAKPAVTAKTATEAPGNQGPANAPHTKPGTAKETALVDKMHKTATPTSAAPLQKVGADKLGEKKGASNAAEKMYPRMKRVSAKRG